MADRLLTEESTAPGDFPRQPSPRLVTLAILKANWNDGRSYLDNFIPFVAECLRISSMSPISLEQVQVALHEHFGMRVPLHAVRTILRRATKRGLVSSTSGRYVPNGHRLAEVALSPHQSDLLRCYEALVIGLKSFALERYGVAVGDAEAERVLDAYVDDYAVPIALSGNVPDVLFGQAVSSSPTHEYIVHAFVGHLAASDPNRFGYLEAVIQGSMLASVLYLPDPGSVQRRFGDSTIYCDTPFLLRLSGHCGRELAAPAQELVDLLRAYGASLACFDHTIFELRGVLLGVAQSAAKGLSAQYQSEVAEHLLQSGLGRSDIELIAARLEQDVRQKSIRIVRAPSHVRGLTVDERDLERALREHVGYFRDATLFHDLNSLTAIYRLRRGEQPPLLEESRALFVTTNRALVRVARKFFVTDPSGFTWPPAILDSDLGTLVWLKQPMKTPDLPRRQILADCYAALRPSPTMWRRWLAEIEQLASSGEYRDEDLDLLRFSPDAQRALMDRTFGNPDAVDRATAADVLARTRAAVAEPIERKLELARSELAAERQMRLAAEEDARRAGDARSEIEGALRRERSSRHDAIGRRADRVARRVAWIAYVALLVLLATTVAVSTLEWVIPSSHLPGWLRVTSALGASFLAFVTWAGGGWGWHVRSFVDRLHKWLRPRLFARYLRRIGEEAR